MKRDRVGIPEQTFYRWKKQYVGLEVDQFRQLKQLQEVDQKSRADQDPKLTGSAYEKDLVEHGFKWSPVKVYRREMSRVQGEIWRLALSVEHRSGQATVEPQRAALIITISDPLKKAPVYDEMVVQMNNLGWAANDLQIRKRLRQ
jgi:hypothetical protein